MLSKQAKVLSSQQITAVLNSFRGSRNAARNTVIFLLSLHGLRAKECAELQLSMITDCEGNLTEAIALEDKASKGDSGRVVPMNKALQIALKEYLAERNGNSPYVIVSERSERFSANAIAVFFKRLYNSLGFTGCSSHSGRRTFLTNCARKVSQAGGSIRDVMALAGHKNLQTTQRYLDQDAEAQKNLVKMLYAAVF